MQLNSHHLCWAGSGAFHSTEMTLGLSSLWPLCQFPDCWKLLFAQVCKQHTQAHSHWFCPVPVGGDLYPSLIERFRPVWKQQGCTVTHTHTAELMDHPMLWSLQTGWRYRTLTLTARRELGSARLLSSSILPLLFSQSLSLHCSVAMTISTSCWWISFPCYLDMYTPLSVLSI